jgi:hypothetical protein
MHNHNIAENLEINKKDTLLWKSQSSQFKRFKVISKILENVQFDSIVDTNAGFGDLYLHLKNNLDFNNKQYVGINNNPNMVEIANFQTQQTILQKDMLLDNNLPVGDFYVSSGNMNFLNKREIFFYISKMLLFSNNGIIFNILEKSELKNRENYNRLSMSEILYFLKPFNLKIKILRGYLQDDITIFALKK